MTVRQSTLLVCLLVCGNPGVRAADASKAVKVFILAGQSNMEGQAVADLDGKDYNDGKGTLNALFSDPAKAKLLSHLKTDKGEWAVRDDVWVWYQREDPQRGEKPEPPKPTSHTIRHVEGWTVRVDDRLLSPPNLALGARALRFLEYKLADIRAVVAAGPLAKLQAVPIVLDLSHGKLRAMQYHPNADWLRENGYSTNLVKCVHIPEAADLATPRNINEQPWVILHELAHAYHDQVLSFDDSRILQAYERFKKSGHGDAVLLFDGTRVRHYGLTDHKEFFAEMSEAYFGQDDFFPSP